MRTTPVARGSATNRDAADVGCRSVFVFRRSSDTGASFDVALELGGDDTLTSPQLPGFALAPATIIPG